MPIFAGGVAERMAVIRIVDENCKKGFLLNYEKSSTGNTPLSDEGKILEQANNTYCRKAKTEVSLSNSEFHCRQAGITHEQFSPV